MTLLNCDAGEDSLSPFVFFWRRPLRVPWTARRLNQSVLKEINPESWKNWCRSLLWPSGVKSELTRKDSDVRKDRRQREQGATENEMVISHRRLNGHEFEQTLGNIGGEKTLECCRQWGHQGSDTTSWLKSKKRDTRLKQLTCCVSLLNKSHMDMLHKQASKRGNQKIQEIEVKRLSEHTGQPVWVRGAFPGD